MSGPGESIGLICRPIRLPVGEHLQSKFMLFTELGLQEQILKAITDNGYTQPTPIQAQAIPAILAGKDVMAAAQTGTGKTAGFTLPVLQRLSEGRRAGANRVRALVLTPTRELAAQVLDSVETYGQGLPLSARVVFGGVKINPQMMALRKGADILVATPGRLLDLHNQNALRFDDLEILVLDEADRMLDMGFIPQVKRIVRATPPKSHRQTLFFSATFTYDVLALAEQWTDKAVTVEIQPESVATDTVTQHIYLVSTEEKFALLYNLLQQEDVESLMVFANRRDECRRLHQMLLDHGLEAGLLSGEIAQNKRERTVERLRTGKLDILVATDVAARGIHIDGISHVVNFTLPEEPEDYVHRIGRTGRAGNHGTSISFACEDDALRLEPIKQLLGMELKCEQPPESLLVDIPQVEYKSVRRSNSGGGNNRRRRNGGGGNRRRS